MREKVLYFRPKIGIGSELNSLGQFVVERTSFEITSRWGAHVQTVFPYSLPLRTEDGSRSAPDREPSSARSAWIVCDARESFIFPSQNRYRLGIEFTRPICR